MPTFPGDKYPLPPAEIEFRARRAAREERSSARRDLSATFQAPPAPERPFKPKSARDEAQRAAKRRKAVKLRTSKAAPQAKRRLDPPKKRLKAERVQFPHMANPRRRPGGAGSARGGVRFVSGGLPTLGKTR